MTHAIVIGGSMAGLLAARVLSDHFERVTVVERDTLPDSAEFRNGVPQSRHLHVLLAHGREIVQSFFPGIHDDLIAMGAPYVDLSREGATLTAGGWIKRFDSHLETYLISRVGLEWQVRRHLSRRGNITFLPEHEVESVVTTADHKTVTGINAVSRRDKSTQTLMADLVVDASGRESKVPNWLESMGYAKPQETMVNAFLGYSTQWFEPPQNFSSDWKTILIGARPKEGISRAGVIFMVEGNRWVVTLGGINKDYPPTEPAEFLEFARSLASPAIYEAIRHAKPITPVYGYRRTENRWRHYEKLERFPERLIVMGDSYCAFNPIYGQGMTIAAIEARALDGLLREMNGLDGLPAKFHTRLSQVTRDAWLLATGEDLRYPATEGERPGWLTRQVQRYVDRVIEIMPYDTDATLTFLQTTNLLKPPTALLHPRIMLNVLRYSLGGKHGDTSANAPVQRVASQGAD